MLSTLLDIWLNLIQILYYKIIEPSLLLWQKLPSLADSDDVSRACWSLSIPWPPATPSAVPPSALQRARLLPTQTQSADSWRWARRLPRAWGMALLAFSGTEGGAVT